MMTKRITNTLISVLMFAFTQITLHAQSNWVRTNPGGGGAVSMLTGTANGTVLSGSDLSGVYKSTNNGQSWTPIGSAQGLTQTAVHSLAPHASDGNTFYIGTGAGIFKATNGGQTVSEATIDVVNGLGYVEAIEMCSVNQNKGYAAHHEWWSQNLTLLKTTDGGDNWFILTGNNLPAQGSLLRMMAHPQNDDLVYALFGKGRESCTNPWLYKSTDGGWNWTRVATTLGDILDFDLHPTNQQIVFASTFQSNGCGVQISDYVGGSENTGALFRSTDAGASFSQIGANTGFINVGTNPNNIAVTNFLFPMNWSTNPPTYNSLMGTWKTSNGGSTWAKTGDLPDWDTGWPIRNYAYTRSFYGLNKTVTKDKFNSGNYYASYGGFAWVTSDGGDNFTNVATQEVGTGKYLSTGMDNINGNSIDVSDSDPNTVYVGYYDLGFWYTRDRGLSWKFSIPDANTYPAYVWGGGGGSNVNFVLNDPQRENVVWSTFGEGSKDTKGAIFKSTAYGENWQISNTGLQALGYTTHGMSIDLNSTVNNRTLYVTQNGNVYKSTNDGASWFLVLNNGGLKFTAVDRFNSQLVYAGGENGFWRSTNGGSTWTETGLAEMRNQQSGTSFKDDIVPTYAPTGTSLWNGVFEIKADPNTPNRVYATAHGAGKGAYKSDNGGVTWTKMYTNNYMRGIEVHPSNSNLLYISSSRAYHSGGYAPEAEGFLMSEDGGVNWTAINADMSWTFGGRMEIDKSPNPRLWAWSPGTGVQYTEVAGATSGGCITIDNDFSDWSSIATLSASNGYTIKAADDTEALYIYIDGNIDQTYQFFLDADNENSNGNEYTATNWGGMGANILIENGGIYTYAGTGFDWTWTYQGQAEATKASAGIELKIDKSFFSTNIVNFGFLTKDADWTTTGFTPATNAATHTFSNTLNCGACISIDADFSDWSSVPTLSTSNGFTLKTTNNNDFIYIYVNGNLDTNNQFYLDADNNNSGGNEYTSTNWGSTGFNYLIQNNSFLTYTGSGADWSWSASSPINVQKTATEIEVEIDKSFFTTNTINFGFATRDANWAQVGFAPLTLPATYTLAASVSCDDAAEPHIITSSDCIEVIPNPLVDKVVIDGVFDDYTLHVLDVNGTLITDYTGTSAPLTIDLNTLGTGIHFINIIHNQNSQLSLRKMIKM